MDAGSGLWDQRAATGAAGGWKKRYQQVVADSKWIRQGLVREVCRGRR